MDIELWDGTVIEGVPDGLSRSEIRMGLLKRGINPDPPADAVDPTEGMSWLEKFGAGVGKSFVDTGRGAKQLLNIGDQDALKATIAEERELTEPLMDTGAGVAGLAAGHLSQLLAPGGALLRAGKVMNSARAANAGRSLMAPLTFKGAAAQGAALGALQPTLSDKEAMAQVGLGAAGGVLGQGLAKVIGSVAKPLTNKLGAEERRLAELAEAEGIPLTAAQRTGTKPTIAAAMENLPFTAGPQRELYDEQLKAFNRAALKRAGIAADEASPEILSAQKSALGEEFKRLSKGREVPLGDGFLDKLADVDAAQAELRGILDTAQIDKLVNGMLDKLGKGKLSGEAAQTIRSELTKAAKDARNAGHSRFADALRTMRNGIDDAISDAMSPADRKLWAEVRRKYANLKTIQKAMTGGAQQGAARGNIQPSSLSTALKSGDREGFAYGSGDLNDLARVGQAFLRPTIGDSGTAQRTFWQNALTGGGMLGTGATASGVTGDPTYAGLALASLAAPRGIQKLLTNPAVQRYLAEGLVENPGLVSELLRRSAIAGGSTVPALGN